MAMEHAHIYLYNQQIIYNRIMFHGHVKLPTSADICVNKTQPCMYIYNNIYIYILCHSFINNYLQNGRIESIGDGKRFLASSH